MRQKIENELKITVAGLDLTTIEAGSIEFYVRQSNGFFGQYTPTVVNANTMAVTIPKADAMTLTPTTCKLQFAFIDANGNPQASEIAEIAVAVLLKETGYGN